MARIKILAIDNDKVCLELITLAFNPEDYDVKTISNPIGLVGIIDNFNPDIIFVDINTPNMVGEKVIYKLKDSRFKDTPIIFLTTNLDSDVHKKVFLLGCAGVIIKPFNLSTLLSEVRPVIEINRLKKLTERLRRCAG